MSFFFILLKDNHLSATSSTTQSLNPTTSTTLTSATATVSSTDPTTAAPTTSSTSTSTSNTTTTCDIRDGIRYIEDPPNGAPEKKNKPEKNICKTFCGGKNRKYFAYNIAEKKCRCFDDINREKSSAGFASGAALCGGRSHILSYIIKIIWKVKWVLQL